MPIKRKKVARRIVRPQVVAPVISVEEVGGQEETSMVPPKPDIRLSSPTVAAADEQVAVSPSVESANPVGSLDPVQVRSPQFSFGQNNNNNEIPLAGRKNKKLFIFGAIICLVVAGVTVGVLLIKANSQTAEEKKEETEAQETTMPEATPSPALVKSDWKFEVLNGTGITGMAKKAAQKLIDRGYEVIAVGNADESDYKETQLFVSSELLAKAELLLKDIKEDFKEASFAGELRDSTASARLIIGEEI